MIIGDATGVAGVMIGGAAIVLTLVLWVAQRRRDDEKAERSQASRFTAWVEPGGLTARAGDLLVVLVGFNNASTSRLEGVEFDVTTTLGSKTYRVGGVGPEAGGVATVPIRASENHEPLPGEEPGLVYRFTDVDEVKWIKKSGEKLRKVEGDAPAS
jgi:hypothetical protein